MSLSRKKLIPLYSYVFLQKFIQSLIIFQNFPLLLEPDMSERIASKSRAIINNAKLNLAVVELIIF